MATKYFLYSKEYLDEQNEILNSRGKQLVPGTVTVAGSKKQYTQLSNSPELPRFIDTKVVASGELKNCCLYST